MTEAMSALNAGDGATHDRLVVHSRMPVTDGQPEVCVSFA